MYYSGREKLTNGSFRYYLLPIAPDEDGGGYITEAQFYDRWRRLGEFFGEGEEVERHIAEVLGHDRDFQVL
jgi:hypothetical protein